MSEPVAWMWETPTNRGLTWTRCTPPDAEIATVVPLYTGEIVDALAKALRELVRLHDELRRYSKLQADSMNPFGGGLTDARLAEMDALTRNRTERERAAWDAARIALAGCSAEGLSE